MLSPFIIAFFMIIAYWLYRPMLRYKTHIILGVWLFLAVIVFLKPPFSTPFVKGYIGFSMLYVVMITGALPTNWKLYARLKAMRALYSIVGFILLMAHPLFYAVEVLEQVRSIPWYGVVSFLIMIPLFITSFITVRKAMSVDSWKKLQKFAYLSYTLIFIHLLIQASSMQNMVVAVALFVLYGLLKVKKECQVKKQ